MTRRWILLVATAAACGGPPRAGAPLAGTPVAPVGPPVVQAAPPAPAHHERIRFEHDRARITNSEVAALDAVVRWLTADPEIAVQISGHTDPSETDADNTGPTGLSHGRATVVRDYLVAHGIAEHRLVLREVGMAEPRGSGANARVEFERVTIKVKPLQGRVIVTDTDVEILDLVTFEPDREVIAATSFPALDAVAATLLGDPGILLVEVQSHTDERGDAGVNLRLTDARAAAVVTYLVGKGVERTRLVPQGYGATQPLDAHHTEMAWAKNRRVAFLILKRTP